MLHGFYRNSLSKRLVSIAMKNFFRLIIFSAIIISVLCFSNRLVAQELSEKQRRITDRFGQLEQILLRMSEASSASDPKRAALLKRVLLVGKDKLLGVRMENLVRLLAQRQLTETIAGQEDIEKDLVELLRLLESENRDQRREAEKERIKKFLRELEELIHQEKALKAKTTQREDQQVMPLENEQRNIRLRSQRLREEIDGHEDPLNESKKSEQDDNAMEKQSQDKQNDEQSKDGDDQQTNENAKEGNESHQDENSEKFENKDKTPADRSNDGPAEKPRDSSERPSGSPTQQAMQKALHRMRQSEQKLKNAEKSGAIEDQEEAIAELQKVKAELEKILRQLREEELMQTLEKLEARFKRMLKNQQAVRSQTAKLIEDMKTVAESARRQIEIQAVRLADDENAIIIDADSALLLLREDGTAQAMTESLIQTRFDMDDIKERLTVMRLDQSTLNVEDAVIASLQEMLEAISQAIKEAEKRQENSQQSPPGNDGRQQVEPLIQLLSELRMVRSMQDRVNGRTKRYENDLEQFKNDPDADLNSLKKKVEELARQQNRISKILHDLKVGRTQ